MASTWRVVAARSMENQVFRARARLRALASSKANAVVVVHGSGTLNSASNTGPYRVEYSVLVTVVRPPPGARAVTVTARLVMAAGWPLTSYSVGCPGTRVSW